jgi:hypothetical protein
MFDVKCLLAFGHHNIDESERGRMRQQRIPMPTIKDLQQSFEDAPEHESHEVSKVQALRLLSPQILLMQSKGYNMAHIASLLSERGVTVTAATLKSHLSRFKSTPAPQPPRNKRPHATGAGAVPVATRSPTGAAPNPAVTEPVAATGSQSVPSRETTQAATPSVAAASRESVPRRAGFTVRPDTKDI